MVVYRWSVLIFNWSTHPSAAENVDAVYVNVFSRPALLADIEARLTEGEGFTLATLNLDHVVKLRHDPTFRQAYARHSHITADGQPVVWLSKLAGQKVELIPGSELMEPLVEIAARLGMPIAFLGSTQETLNKAEAELMRRHAGLNVVAKIAPAMGFDPDGEAAGAAIQAIGASGARLCFLALGAPKQEVFAARAQALQPHIGFLSFGAGIDFIAGAQTRAPKLFRVLALEWLWRLCSNPRRFARRYAGCFAILPDLTLQAWTSRRSKA